MAEAIVAIVSARNDPKQRGREGVVKRGVGVLSPPAEAAAAIPRALLICRPITASAAAPPRIRQVTGPHSAVIHASLFIGLRQRQARLTIFKGLQRGFHFGPIGGDHLGSVGWLLVGAERDGGNYQN